MHLIRLEKGDHGTFGVLRSGGDVFCLTLEPPDRENIPQISCIPSGRYVCRRVASPRFGLTFEITDVPGRSHILFHRGNVAADTSGCVLLGSRFGVLGRARGVLDSGTAFAAFMERCAGRDEFILVIDEACGEGPWIQSV
jgi:hypothetical protein